MPNIEAEKKLINILLRQYPQGINKFIEAGLDLFYFSYDSQIVIQAILDNYEKNIKLTRKAFVKLLERHSAKDAARLETFYNACWVDSESLDNFYVLKNEIQEAYLSSLVTNSYSSFIKETEKNGIKVAFKNLAEKLTELDVDKTTNDREKIFYDNASVIAYEKLDYIKKVIAGEIEEKPKLLSGYKPIDDTMVTGFAPGTLSLVVADVGSYKSIIMMNVAINVWKQGFDVLFVPIEMEKGQVLDRVIANMAEVPFQKFYNLKNMTEEDIEKIGKAADELEKGKGEDDAKLYILQIPYETTVSGIRKQIDKHVEMFKPKLVVIDYIDNLAAEKQTERHDLQISEMLQTLRSIGKIQDFAVLSGAQLGRDALKKLRKSKGSDSSDLIQSEDIRGAHTFSSDSDYIWGQVKNSSQPNSLLDIFVVKARNGSPVFADGHSKATLELYPEICTIKDQAEFGSIGSLQQRIDVWKGEDGGSADGGVIDAQWETSSDEFDFGDDDPFKEKSDNSVNKKEEKDDDNFTYKDF